MKKTNVHYNVKENAELIEDAIGSHNGDDAKTIAEAIDGLPAKYLEALATAIRVISRGKPKF